MSAAVASGGLSAAGASIQVSVWSFINNNLNTDFHGFYGFNGLRMLSRVIWVNP
jgi:hypothetical protein